MYRERVSENIHVFTSELYAQVTAGVVATTEGAIVIDTLPFPSEAKFLAAFVERRCPGGARYVVLTHHHADHTYGAYLFPEAEVVAHARCRQMLKEMGETALIRSKEEAPELEEVELRLPEVTFDGGGLSLHLGGKTVRLIASPGHTWDSIIAYVEEDRVLFAADTIMPVPTIAGGDPDALKRSLTQVLGLPLENIVQGHGEVVLRGETRDVVENSIAYLERIQAKVEKVIQSGQPRDALLKTGIERCGLSRIPLNGLVQRLHTANLLALYDKMMGQRT